MLKKDNGLLYSIYAKHLQKVEVRGKKKNSRTGVTDTVKILS